MKYGKIIFACLIVILALGAVNASQETDNNLTTIDEAMVVEDSNLEVAEDQIAVGDENSTDAGDVNEDTVDESVNGTEVSKKEITASDFFVYTEKSLSCEDDDWDSPQILVADFPENGTLKIFVNGKLKFTENVDAQKGEYVYLGIDGIKQRLGIKTLGDYKMSIKYAIGNKTFDLADYDFLYYDADVIFISDLLVIGDNDWVGRVHDVLSPYVAGKVKVSVNGKTVYSKSFKASKKLRFLDIKSSEFTKGYKPGKYKVKVTYASSTGKTYSLARKVRFVKTVPEISAPEEMSVGEKQSIIIKSAKGTSGTVSVYNATVRYYDYQYNIKDYKKVAKLFDVKVVNGYASIPLNNLTTGKYDLVLEYNIEGYKNSEKLSIEVLNNTEGFSAKVVPLEISYGEIIKVKAYGQNLSYKYGYIDIDNIYAGNLKLMSGYASKVFYGLKVGKHTVRVQFSGDDYYFSKTFEVVVKKSNISLTLDKVNVKKSASKFKITADLKIKGKAAKYKYVTFKFNKKTFKVKTNKKGIATVNIPKKYFKNLKAGSNISYTVNYDKVYVKKTVKVLK